MLFQLTFILSYILVKRLVSSDCDAVVISSAIIDGVNWTLLFKEKRRYSEADYECQCKTLILAEIYKQSLYSEISQSLFTS